MLSGGYTVGFAYAGDGSYGPASASSTLTVTPATLTATGVNFSATAGAPFRGTLATFSNVPPNASPYTAVITWGDGSTSTVSVSVTGSSLAVTAAHTYADPKSYAVGVQISNPNTTTAQLTDTATVSSLGLGVVRGLTGGIGFWHNSNGQTLIDNFNSGDQANPCFASSS